MILREHPHFESNHTTKAFTVSLTNHLRRVSCITNSFKSSGRYERKKFYVESAKVVEMDEFSAWKPSRTKEEKNNKTIITIILIVS